MKFDAPAPGNADRLLRPRLIERVNALLEPPARALWICAGAGMGKSTVAVQALAARADAGVHLRLDATSADGVGAAWRLAEHLEAPARHALSLTREQIAAPALGLAPLWRRLWAAWTAGSWIVLDDLQRAGSDAMLGAWLPGAIEALLNLSPARPDLRLVLVSRRAPPPALARLQLGGVVTRLPAAELAFDDAELQAWRPGAARRLGTWPVALSRHATGEPSEPLLRQLLASEVMPELSPCERTLLGRLAWLPDCIESAAAARLGGDAQAARRLDDLAERGLLVDRVGAGTWRLHELLAEMLRNTGDETWQATVAWLEARATAAAADAAIAVAHSAAAADARGAWAEAGRLLVAHAPRWLAACRHVALADLCTRVPEAERSAELWGALAAALAPLDARAGREAAQRALQLAPAAATGLRLAALTQIIASHFQTFDSTLPLSHWLTMLAPLAQTRPALTPDAAASLAIGAYSALFLREPAHPEGPRWQAEVRALPAAAAVDPNLRLRATMLLAKQAWYTAAHAEAMLLPDAARGALGDARCTPYSRLLWGLAQQYRAWAAADPAAGRAASAEALVVAEASGVRGLDRHLRLHDACFARLLGDEAGARAQFEAAAASADPSRRMEAWHLYSVQAWLALEDGALAFAEAAAQLAIEAAAAMGPAPQAMSQAIAGQIALAAERSPADAIAALRTTAARDGNARAALFAYWLEAGAALQRGDAKAAQAPLAAALATMRRCGSGLWFGLHHALAARLADRALAEGLQPEAARLLVRQQRLAPPPGASAHWPWDIRITGLGRPETLAIETRGRPVALGPKVPRRPLELLHALIEAGGHAHAAQLADRLWPESDGDRAMHAFEVALRRARALLGQADALVLAGGMLSLDRRRVWFDHGAAPRAAGADPAAHAQVAAPAP